MWVTIWVWVKSREHTNPEWTNIYSYLLSINSIFISSKKHALIVLGALILRYGNIPTHLPTPPTTPEMHIGQTTTSTTPHTAFSRLCDKALLLQYSILLWVVVHQKIQSTRKTSSPTSFLKVFLDTKSIPIKHRQNLRRYSPTQRSPRSVEHKFQLILISKMYFVIFKRMQSS